MSAPRVIVVDDTEPARALEARLRRVAELPLDVESNGLHAYRAITCTVQLGIVSSESSEKQTGPRGDPAIDEAKEIDAVNAVDEVAVLDPLAKNSAILPIFRQIFGAAGPVKIVHDLAFDARMLARDGVPLGNVFDTSLAARFLGITSTSLASLVFARLGVTLSKELQHHDWGKRPLGVELHDYLAADVAHLPALARALRLELAEKDIAEEVRVETEYRLAKALASEDEDPRPFYARIKGANELDGATLAVLREVAEVRERAAERWDVPPFKAVGNDVLIVLAKKKPTTLDAVRRTRGLDRGRGASLASELFDAIARGISAGDIPQDERGEFFTQRPPPPRPLVEARRAREHRLIAFRRAEAKRRGVDEQVVLPGHCLQEIADRAPETLDSLAEIGGIGAIRIERYGEAIVAAVVGSEPSTDRREIVRLGNGCEAILCENSKEKRP